ncbi:MAG: type III pantothenate kinase [Pirellulaceae bacterium]|nr:type III pantothenate kinase [Pirellulaceae bacterium]
MTNDTCIVAVDVGNSAVKLCVQRGDGSPVLGRDAVDTDDSLIDHAIAIDAADWQRDAMRWVSQRVGCRTAHWRIASVHRRAADELERAIQESIPRDSDAFTVSRVTRDDVPMKACVSQPDRLGIDRLLGAYAAVQRYGSPIVVVDAGSAVTIDWVDSSQQFCGGAILPGLRLQTEVLASGTDALPEIDWHDVIAGRGPATNTSDAIRLGVLTGVAAAIDRLAGQYAEMSSSPQKQAQMVVTGGDSPAISPYLRHLHKIVPNLVCRGLLDLPRSSN